MTANSSQPDDRGEGSHRRRSLIGTALLSLFAMFAIWRYCQQPALPIAPSKEASVVSAESGRQRKTARDLWRRNGLIWAALMILLILTFSFAYVPLGAANTPIALAIGGIKAALVVWLFMELAKSSALTRLAAATGVVWLCVMFTLTLADIIARLHGG